MFDSLTSLLGKAKHGILAASLLGTMLAPALTAHAATASISFSPSTSNVASVSAGQTITVDVMANTDTPTLGWQFGVSWDPAVVSLTTADLSKDDFLKTYAAGVSGASVFSQPGTINNTTGQLSPGGDAILGAGSNPGPQGSGRLATLTFHAIANGSTALTLTPGATTGSFLSGVPTTLNNGLINVGPIAAPNLTVQNATTTAVSGTPNQFTVGFTVANIGTANAGASHYHVAVTGATPATADGSVNALAAGANQAITGVGPFTLASGQTLANVTVTADSVSTDVPNDQRTAPTGTTAYQFSTYSSNGTTPINATYGGFLRLTAPAAITNEVFQAGQDNLFGGGSTDVLNILSNLSSWQVTVSGDNSGFFHEYDPGVSAYVTSGAQLLTALKLQAGIQPQQSLTGTATAFVNGTRAGQNAQNGQSFTVNYDQFVGYNDAPVNAPHTYKQVITWAAAGTF